MEFSALDQAWMNMALAEAEQAAREGEIPVGAIIVKHGECIASAHNRCEQDHDATAHAERLVIETACKRIGSWRLSECTLYVTLEPCPMCAGAAINARLGRIVYAAKDARAGALGSVINLSALPLEARPVIEHGLLAEKSRGLLRQFFEQMRNKTDHCK